MNKKINLTLVLVALFLLWFDSAFAQKPLYKSREGVGLPSVLLITDKSIYKLGEKITAKLLLLNNSCCSIYLYSYLAWGESASYSLWLKDAASGKDVAQMSIKDSLTPAPESKEDFIKIPSGGIYGVTIYTDSKDLGVDKAGDFELIADFHSPISKNFGFGLPILGREDGVISSNIIRLRFK